MSHHDETKPDGVAKAPRADDSDVEGHSLMRAAEPDGVAKAPRVDDEDVEGHGLARAAAPAGVAKAPRADDDEDVEGHYGQLKGPSSRGE